MAKIKNFNDIAVSSLRKKALEIAEAGLSAIDTKNAVRKNVRLEGDFLFVKNKKYLLGNFKNIYVVGVGKCSIEAGKALEEIFGERLKGGIVLGIHEGELNKIKTYKGTHPLPSQYNIEVTEKIISLLKEIEENDLVITIVSGGGSVLLSQPKGFALEEEKKIVDFLLGSGVDIAQMNTVRKHLSLARGGFLAEYAYPAKVISLVFSDVPGHPAEIIASGPMMMDPSTVDDAEKILNKYRVLKNCGIDQLNLIETPKDGKYFKNVDNFLIVSNKIALEEMSAAALAKGFMPSIKSTGFSGEAKVIGEKIIKELEKEESKTVLLYGGESTVKVHGKGNGGRNQELALSALQSVKEGEILVSFNSDGRDNGSAAGAICDIISKEKAKNLGLDSEKYLKNNDSHAFFSETGDFVFTGDTGSNVADLIIAIKE
ncbi:MAG: DUF4147 domain-containing protein [Candidatus Pacebacteria bacterium]|nr:DUF4147 domain-containing protein [Candidatus Paceibacterota bacterium]